MNELLQAHLHEGIARRDGAFRIPSLHLAGGSLRFDETELEFDKIILDTGSTVDLILPLSFFGHRQPRCHWPDQIQGIGDRSVPATVFAAELSFGHWRRTVEVWAVEQRDCLLGLPVLLDFCLDLPRRRILGPPVLPFR